MNNYTPDATKAIIALKAISRILKRIAAEAPDVKLCGISYNGSLGEKQIHVFRGIDTVVSLYSCPVQVVSRDDEKYPLRKETTIDGVELFEIMSAGKGNL